MADLIGFGYNQLCKSVVEDKICCATLGFDGGKNSTQIGIRLKYDAELRTEKLTELLLRIGKNCMLYCVICEKKELKFVTQRGMKNQLLEN